ncbi:hypothetical protein U9M48_030834 [Paspalum notatum var. saurae]|uniref:Retrotransposon Copia-like N-terminal domain-containing protein n=1 Tax=Paspalum notatum var. saurae TaxID=547442 RepID=A0AAQ3U197_PASNO
MVLPGWWPSPPVPFPTRPPVALPAASHRAALLLGAQVSEKLTRDNYMLWKSQFLPVVRGAHLMGILDGSNPEPPKTIEVVADNKKQIVANPDHDSWLLSYLLNSITKEVLVLVATATTSAKAWATLESMFSAHSKAQITNLHMQLSTLKKGNLSIPAYFSKMRSI